jgi:DNA-binding CsgD family transcriptional regulator
MTARRGRPPGPTGPKCVALYRRGLTAATIARELGLRHSTVLYHLTQAGVDLKARRAETTARRRVAFAAAWNAAADVGAAAAAAGLSERAASYRASLLRGLGFELKRMPTRRHAGAKGVRVERLVRQGVPTAAIMRRLKVTRQYVHLVRKRLHEPPPG